MDAHIHLPVYGAADAMHQNLAFGVTTDVVMGAAAQLVARVKELSDRPDVAAAITAGNVATAPGGHPTQMDPQQRGSSRRLTTPGEADAFVAARVAEGADFIKIIYDDTSDAYARTLPTLDEKTVAALVAAAHARERLAVAHIGNERFARGAIAAGVDGLAHLFVGPTVSADFGAFAASTRRLRHPDAVGPLFRLRETGRPELPEGSRHDEVCEAAIPKSPRDAAGDIEGVLRRRATGDPSVGRGKVPVLAGTDAPAPGLTYGASLHKELEHLVNAGLTPTAALAAATSAIARAFRMNDRGRIQTGMRADLLLVDGDPSKQIRDTRNIVAIWKQGVRVQRAP